MPRTLECHSDTVLSLADCTDIIAEHGFDPADDYCMDNAIRALRGLSNNSTFLGDMLIEKLAARHRHDANESAYSPQAIILSPVQSGFFLRANIWPSDHDHCFQLSGAHNFAYGVPHDHNFDFLTVGYFGPGYASDYYEYDYSVVAGVVGEKAGLKFIERSVLTPGTMLHYRAHRDVHSQLPPTSLSVSLNVMAVDVSNEWYDQYRFDTDNDAVTETLNSNPTELLLRMAVALGTEQAEGMADHFGRSHPSDRIRLAAYDARAQKKQTDEQRDALWREAELSGSRLLAGEAQRRRAQLV